VRTPATFYPRNVASVAKYNADSSVIVSFVGWTKYDAAHVFVDSGKAYDMAALKGRHVILAVRPGINMVPVLASLLKVHTPDHPVPYIIDFNARKMFVAFSADPFEVYRIDDDRELWRDYFAQDIRTERWQQSTH
jgi:hypothetical protein